MTIRQIILLSILILFSTPTHAQTPDSSIAITPTGYDIIKKQQDLDLGFHDETMMGQMTLHSANGEKTERVFESKRFEKQTGIGEKSLIKFMKPADIQGTGLLSYQNKKADDDQWLYLPSMKKTKRISGSGKSGSFVGSEFSFEDLIPPDIDKYTYQYLKSESCGDTTCYVVSSTPQTSDSGYSKTISWIRIDNYRVVKAEFYDKKDRLLKTATFEDYRLINDKYWRTFRLIMKNQITGKETDFLVENLRINAGLTTTDFTQRALER